MSRQPSPADLATLDALRAAVEKAGGAAVPPSLVARERGVHSAVATRHLNRLADHKLARQAYPGEERVECSPQTRPWLPVHREYY